MLGNQCVVLVLVVLVIGYLFSCLCARDGTGETISEFYTAAEMPPAPEGGALPPTSPATTAPAAPAAAPAPPPSVQALLDLSDILVGEDERAAMRCAAENAEQIQDVNERFNAAKRRTVENKLRPGTVNNKERRRIVEALLRRPNCARRVRSWRTENSDTLRGDVIPKNASSWGLMKTGRSNPAVDLHPGAMGFMSGLQGQWLSEENIPDNAVDDDND